MRLPELDNSEKYVGLYVFDFGDHAGVGFTAQEVAELLESEEFRDGKAYKIHNARPDGTLELRGLPSQTFQLETGMFFYSSDEKTAAADFKRLVNLAVRSAPPCKAKVHLAKYAADKFAVAIIFGAEYNDEMSKWLLDGRYRTQGAAEGGVEAIQRYYDEAPQILDRHQLFARDAMQSRSGAELLANVKVAVQR
jgi:hypothetical protein